MPTSPLAFFCLCFSFLVLPCYCWTRTKHTRILPRPYVCSIMCRSFRLCLCPCFSFFPFPLCPRQDACLVRGSSETKTADNRHRPPVCVRQAGQSRVAREGKKKKVAYSGDQFLFFQSRRLHGGVSVSVGCVFFGLGVAMVGGPSLDRKESDGYPCQVLVGQLIMPRDNCLYSM